MRAEARRDQSFPCALPFLDEFDTETQTGFSLSGYPFIVVTMERLQSDIKHLQGDLGA